jgi:hypothetical protein
MAIVWAQVQAIAPDVETTPSAARALILAHVEANMSAAAWGARLTLGSIYFAAHLATFTCRSLRGEGGPVVSESLDGASVSYAAYIGGAADDLDATPWGRLYRSMRRQAGMGPIVI